MIELSPLHINDRARWELLAREYMAFYKTLRADEEYHFLWQRLLEGATVLSVGARQNGELVGFCHYLFHASSWGADVCYLQDLFVDKAHRGSGIGKKLIQYVADEAKARKSPRLYWLTHCSNETARLLYDKVASHSGFIRYEKALL